MFRNNELFNWFDSVRELPVPKFITGLRGTGKTSILLHLRERLLEDGIPPDHLPYIDTEASELRAFATYEQILTHILTSLPRKGRSCIFIREAAALPKSEIVIGTLAASARRQVIATSSSRRLLDHGLAKYFSSRLAHVEVLPPDSEVPYPADLARARWNDIFLHDVLAPTRILETSLAERIAGWLSDNLGDPVSLRRIATAISPTRRRLSPHTIESYLASMEDAHLVEKVIRWDTAEAAPQKTGYRYFFTDPQLRLARFGPSPDGERRRMALNRAWLRLKHAEGTVFAASGTPGAHFVTQSGKDHCLWRMTADGTLERQEFGRPPP